MFPQAGPIVRYCEIGKQLNLRNETLEKFTHGVQRFIVGLGKKVLSTNKIGMLWDAVKDILESQVLTAWLGLAALTFQIYFDLSA